MKRWFIISYGFHGLCLLGWWLTLGSAPPFPSAPLAPASARAAGPELPSLFHEALASLVNELESIQQELEKLRANKLTELGQSLPPHRLTQPNLARSVSPKSPAHDLVAAYQRAQELEKLILEAYRDLLAAERAITEKVPLKIALEADALPASLHLKISHARSQQAWWQPERRHELDKDLGKLPTLIASARAMLRQAQRLSEPTQKNIRRSLEPLLQRASLHRGSRATGKKGEQYSGLDLSSWMWRSGPCYPHKGAGGNGAIVNAMWLPPNEIEEIQAPVPSPRLRAIPGRKLIGESNGGHWVYPDSWYMIGPFSNERRTQINTRFPPEMLLDLDAIYAVGENAPVQWEFFQSDKPKISPAKIGSDTIFYFTTEIYSDRPRNLWLALGSDDQGICWINDQLIWISDNNLKSCQPDESFRKIYLEKGFNRILFRLENSIYDGAFCFQLYPDSSS
jgi:hypothetical protein